MGESADGPACVVSVPDRFVCMYEREPLIVRTRDVVALVDRLPEEVLSRVEYIVIEEPGCDFAPLLRREPRGSMDVLLSKPDSQYPLLYNFAPLIQTHGVRVSIAVEPGFSRALRVAAALKFPVKLNVAQPVGGLFVELAKALEFYLHDGSVKKPVEFFHSVLIGFLRNTNIPLWDIQEENPRHVLYINGDGDVSLPPRLACSRADLPMPSRQFDTSLLAAHADCMTCAYRKMCQGYFKWPDPSYSCDDMRRLFQTIRDAAVDLAQDIDQSERRAVGPHGT